MLDDWKTRICKGDKDINSSYFNMILTKPVDTV